MTVALRVILLQVIAAAGIAILGFLTYQSIVNGSYHLGRIDSSHHQVETLIEVANASSQYSEDLAEFLLSGSASDKVALAEAREQLRRDINLLEEAVIVEEVFLKEQNQPPDPATDVFTPQADNDLAELESFVGERERVAKIWALFRSLNREIDDTVRLFVDGRRAEALKKFDEVIDGRLDAELDKLLAAAIADEEQEHQEVASATRAQLRWFTTTVGIAVVATILGCVLLGMWVVRSLRSPISELLKGAEAFGGGNLNYRIPVIAADELGALARRFNQMADTLRGKQAELDAGRISLETQVQQRTAELATMNQNLTELGELRTRFLADISHELRTPLTALRGEAEITLRHGRKPAAVYRDALDRIVHHSEEMTKLIDDLLLLARSETGDVLFKPMPISIGPVAAAAARDAAVLGSERKISVDAKIASEAIWVEADPHRLKQAIMILLDNAIKYSSEGQRVGLNLAQDHDRALITVRDEGAGIAKKDLPHIFKRFYRGQGADKSRGSGLGLSIAKWIVDKHGGDISIESVAQQGTAVHVRLPIKRRRGDGEGVAA